MPLALKFYLIDLFCDLPVILLAIAVIFILKIFLIAITDDDEETSRDEEVTLQMTKSLRRGCMWLFISLFAFILIPSRKNLYFYIGVDSIENFIDSDNKAKEIPQLAVEAFHKYLKESLKGDSIK